jgi:hypothetical protein
MGYICYDPSDAYDDKSFGIFIVVGKESQNKVVPWDQHNLCKQCGSNDKYFGKQA